MSLAAPMKVLLVEDDEATARALRVLFHQRAGIEVFWASTLAEARSLLNESPDCILLDLMLPDGGGEELLEDLSDGSKSDLRIVVVSALAETSDRAKKIRDTYHVAFVHKPYEIVDLMRAVKGDPPETPLVTPFQP